MAPWKRKVGIVWECRGWTEWQTGLGRQYSPVDAHNANGNFFELRKAPHDGLRRRPHVALPAHPAAASNTAGERKLRAPDDFDFVAAGSTLASLCFSRALARDPCSKWVPHPLPVLQRMGTLDRVRTPECTAAQLTAFRNVDAHVCAAPVPRRRDGVPLHFRPQSKKPKPRRRGRLRYQRQRSCKNVPIRAACAMNRSRARSLRNYFRCDGGATSRKLRVLPHCVPRACA